jgi:hypothetical protein
MIQEARETTAGLLKLLEMESRLAKNGPGLIAAERIALGITAAGTEATSHT